MKRIRGFTLDDLPCNFQEIMQAFDNMQDINANAVQRATQLLEDTRLWIRILADHEVRESPKYIVASNKIVTACIEILYDRVESTCSKVYVSDLQPHFSHDLPSRLNDLLNVLDRIGKLYMIPETRKIYTDMVTKLFIGQEHLESLVVSN